MPRSKKKKSGNGRIKKFENVFCISLVGLFIFLWLVKEYFQATIVELIVVYLIGTFGIILVLRAINRRAAEHALDILGRPYGLNTCNLKKGKSAMVGNHHTDE